MNPQPEDNKPKEPECIQCHSKGLDIGLLKGLCKICHREKYPDLYEMTPEDEEMLARFKHGEYKPISNNEFDPEKDLARNAWIKET